MAATEFIYGRHPSGWEMFILQVVRAWNPIFIAGTLVEKVTVSKRTKPEKSFRYLREDKIRKVCPYGGILFREDPCATQNVINDIEQHTKNPWQWSAWSETSHTFQQGRIASTQPPSLLHPWQVTANNQMRTRRGREGAAHVLGSQCTQGRFSQDHQERKGNHLGTLCGRNHNSPRYHTEHYLSKKTKWESHSQKRLLNPHCTRLINLTDFAPSSSFPVHLPSFTSRLVRIGSA